MGLCGLDGVLDFKLDPPAGTDQRRTAVVVITGADDKEFTIESCILINADNAAATTAAFAKARELCKAAGTHKDSA